MVLKKIKWQNVGVWLIVIIAFYLVPRIFSEYYVQLTIKMLIMSLLSLSFTLLLGYTGMLSFGQSAYYAVGAYACSLYLKKVSSVSIFVPIVGSVLLSVAIALVIGFFCVKLTKTYFALLTLAFSQLIYAIVLKWYSFTGGDNGLVGIPVPELTLFGSCIDFRHTNNYYYLTLSLVLITALVCKLILDSHFGSILRSIRENPNRTEYLGIRVRNYQLMIFAFAGGVAGLGGALVGPFERSIFPDIAFWTTSGEAAFMSILGGIYNFSGPFIGAIILQLLQNIIRSYTEYWSIIVGGTLIIIVIFLPGGIAGFLHAYYDKFTMKRRAHEGKHPGNSAT